MFNSARLKLTIWYAFIIMLISVTFSMVIYHELENEIDRFARAPRFRIERQLYEEYAVETRQRIILSLLFVNCGIIVFSAGMSYFLAGRTLLPIKKMVDEQSRFISDASHELRTPLTSLKSAFEVYLRDKKPTLAQANELVSESVTEVDKLENLSTSLLQLARFERPNDKKNFAEISLEKTILEAIKKTKSKAEITGAEVKILADHNSLTNLWVILLDNAIKYSPKDGLVNIRIDKGSKVVKVEVEDHGMGITSQDLPHIFERFYRANKARSKEGAGGYGLGLAIAQKIVAEHHGTISVTSQEGKGTIFTVHLPIFS